LLIIQFLYLILADILNIPIVGKTVVEEIFSTYIAARPVILIFSIVAGLLVIGLYLVNNASKVAVVKLEESLTECKKAEEKIRKLNEELEQRVIERTERLEEINKALDAFSFSVSHDLRTPLRAIDGFSGMLMEGYPDKLDDEGKRLLNVIRGNTRKMGELINGLLALSRLGRKEINLLKIDMDKLARVAFDEIKASVPERELLFNIKPLPFAYGDSVMIRQVFTNLMLNAIKFTKPKETAVVEVGGYKEDSINVYYVRDNGVGFDMNYAYKLFGPFQRLHSEKEFEGTGVGLAIVQRIINRHGGRVWAEAKLNEGATFYFTLPKQQINERL
jgi:light-regulated signal transduction histidine kinase (bacteriophytochrome)